MIRPTSLILMLLAAAAGGTLFHVSFEVGALDERLAELNRDIRADREAIHVLRAEWSFLNQPERIEELARRHLDLAPATGGQLAGAATVPVREQEIEAPSPAAGSEPAVIQVAAPRDKPAAPAPRSRADLPRSLDDVLRDVTQATPAGGVQ
jgi:hypothetical protein